MELLVKMALALWAFFGLMAAVCAYIVTLALLKAVTFVILWNWFMVPFGLPGLSLWWALGLMTLIGIFFYQKNDPDSVELRTANGPTAVIGVLLGVLGHLAFYCMLCILFGGFYHWMM